MSITARLTLAAIGLILANCIFVAFFGISWSTAGSHSYFECAGVFAAWVSIKLFGDFWP